MRPLFQPVIVFAEVELASIIESSDPVETNSLLTYTVTVRNNGPAEATGLTVINTLPVGVAFLSASTECTENAGVVTCVLDTLAKDSNAAVTVKMTAPNATGLISYAAEVSARETDQDRTNNMASETTNIVLPSHTLSLTLTGDGPGRVRSSPPGIDCTSGTCAASFVEGTIVTLIAEEPPGSLFENFFGELDCFDGQVTMIAPASCSAAFRAFEIQAISQSETTVGGILSLQGTGFGDPEGEDTVGVKIGGLDAAILDRSDSLIIVKVPVGADQATDKTVQVVVNGTIASGPILTNISPALTSIAVSPANSSIAVGQSQQFTATGTFSDGSQQPLTSTIPLGVSLIAGQNWLVEVYPETGSMIPILALPGLTGVSAGPVTGDAVTERVFVSVHGKLLTVDLITETIPDSPDFLGVSSMHFDSVSQRLLGIAQIAGDNKLVEINPKTGVFTEISQGLPGLTGMSAGAAALDPAGQRYFVSIAGSLVTIHTQDGTFSSVPFSGFSGPSSMEYDPVGNQLIGIGEIAGSHKLITIDPVTGGFTQVSATALPGLPGVSSGVSALDSTGQRYFASLNGQLVTISIADGSVLFLPEFPGVSSLGTVPLWSSGNAGKASITPGGLATALNQGVTTIKATSGNVNGTTSLTVGIGIDATILPFPTFDIDGVATGLDTQTIHILQLLPGTYNFRVPGIGNPLPFNVSFQGVVTFDSTLSGFFSGNGTGTLIVKSVLLEVFSLTVDLDTVAIVDAQGQLVAEGGGTVTSLPAGITCASQNLFEGCSAFYPEGATVTLTAAPEDGSTFEGWSGPGCAGVPKTEPCSFSMDRDRNITASFCLSDFNQENCPTSVPRGVEAQPVTSTTIIVSWQTVPIATAYNVYIGTQSGVYEPPVRVLAPKTTHTFTGLIPGVTYFFVVTTVIEVQSGPLSSPLVEGALQTEKAIAFQESGFSVETSATPDQNLDQWQVVDGGDREFSDWFEEGTGGEMPVIMQGGNIHTAGDSGINQLGTHIFLIAGLPQGRTDYKIIQSLQSDSNGALGFLFRYIDAQHYYRFSWDLLGGYRRLVKREGSVFTLLCEENLITNQIFGGCVGLRTDEEQAYDPNLPYNVELEADDSQPNGNLAIRIVHPFGFEVVNWQIQDNSLLGNGFAFYSSHNPGGRYQFIAFDDLGKAPPQDQVSLDIRKIGTGQGIVVSCESGALPCSQRVQAGGQALTGPLINCDPDCSQTVPSGSVVMVEAVPANGFQFAGWSGQAECGAAQPGVTAVEVTVNSNTACVAEFTGVASIGTSLDLNADLQFTPDLDGMLVLRYLFGLRGPALVQNLIDPVQDALAADRITGLLDLTRTTMLDVDGNGQSTAMTDGLLIQRFLSGSCGDSLVNGVVDPAGVRNTATLIEGYLAGFAPGVSTCPGAVSAPIASSGFIQSLAPSVVGAVESEQASMPQEEEPPSVTQPLMSAPVGEESTSGEGTKASIIEAEASLDQISGMAVTKSGLPPQLHVEPALSEGAGMSASPLAEPTQNPGQAATESEPFDPLAPPAAISGRPAREASDASSVGPWILPVIQDSTLVRTHPHRNLGEHPLLQVGGKHGHYVVLEVDLAAVRHRDFREVQLKLIPFEPGKNLRKRGSRLPVKILVQRLGLGFTEGNGGMGTGRRKRGDGPGVTWACGTDASIANRQQDCMESWRGGLAGIVASQNGRLILYETEGAVLMADVTADVRTALDEGATTIRWLLRPARSKDKGWVMFYSREGARDQRVPGKAPHLVVR